MAFLLALASSSIGRVLDCRARGPGFKPQQRQKKCLCYIAALQIPGGVPTPPLPSRSAHATF